MGICSPSLPVPYDHLLTLALLYFIFHAFSVLFCQHITCVVRFFFLQLSTATSSSSHLLSDANPYIRFIPESCPTHDVSNPIKGTRTISPPLRKRGLFIRRSPKLQFLPLIRSDLPLQRVFELLALLPREGGGYLKRVMVLKVDLRYVFSL